MRPVYSFEFETSDEDGTADIKLSVLIKNSAKTMLGSIVAPKSGPIEILK